MFWANGFSRLSRFVYLGEASARDFFKSPDKEMPRRRRPFNSVSRKFFGSGGAKKEIPLLFRLRILKRRRWRGLDFSLPVKEKGKRTISL